MSGDPTLVRTMLEVMPDPVLIIGPDGLIVDTNRQAKMLTGLEAGDDYVAKVIDTNAMHEFLSNCRRSTTHIPGRFCITTDQSFVIFGCRLSLPGILCDGSVLLRIDKRLRLAGKFANLNTLHDALKHRVAWSSAEQERLNEMARRDPLTRALNRRAFTDRLNQEVERAKRYNTPLTLALFDLDHFKKINDTHGHQTGDEILKHFVGLCEKSVRIPDTLARIGGEEFALLLPETSKKTGFETADRVRQIVETTPVSTGAQTVAYSTSVGISTLRGTDTIDTLLKRADRNLYAAKAAGRNRTMSDDCAKNSRQTPNTAAAG